MPEKRTIKWWQDDGVRCYETFPSLFVFIIWEAQNKEIFHDKWIPLDDICALMMKKLQEHIISPTLGKRQIIVSLDIKKNIPKAFFLWIQLGRTPSWMIQRGHQLSIKYKTMYEIWSMASIK